MVAAGEEVIQALESAVRANTQVIEGLGTILQENSRRIDRGDGSGIRKFPKLSGAAGENVTTWINQVGMVFRSLGIDITSYRRCIVLVSEALVEGGQGAAEWFQSMCRRGEGGPSQA